MSRRKGTPCACNTDPCSCGSSRNCIRAVNNVSPDPNGDLVIRGGTGIEIVQSGDDLVINNTANPNAFVAGNNIELNPSGDDIAIDLVDEPVVDGLTVNGNTQLNGDLEVNGDIIQNGAAYETHAEHIYTRDDFIIMRDGAIAALAPGDYAGFKVKLYDGVNDGALVIDNSGTARVGDVGDEQPLLTRDEAADLTDGDLLQWDGTNFKAVDAGKKISDLVKGSGNIGSDTKPVKIVNDVATPITNDLTTQKSSGTFSGQAWGFGILIGSTLYLRVPYFRDGRRLSHINGSLLIRDQTGDLATVNLSFDVYDNAVGQATANVDIGSNLGTKPIVQIQIDGSFTFI